MSYSRRMLVGLKNMMKVCNVPYVIYGDTDSIVLRNVDMNELVHMYPSLLDHHLAIDMLLPTGEIECTGDIIVLGKKLYYINDNKFSCKGHNRKEISKELFEKCNNGFVITTSRMSPYKSILQTESKTIHTTVTRISKQHRSMQITLPPLKRLIKNGILVGPIVKYI